MVIHLIMGHEILKRLRKERGWTLSELAERINSYPQQISKYELGQTELTLEWIKKFAQVFAVAPSLIMGEDIAKKDIAKTERFADNAVRKLTAAEHDYAAPPPPGYEIPLYGSAAAFDGRIDAVDAVTGRLDLRALRDSFAVTVSGNSMEPRYRHGDYALVARGEWPQPYQDCLIETQDDQGYIKVYISHKDKTLICEQLNPRQKWEMPMAKVRSVQLVRGRWK